jgi:phosphate starvation-inducible PhoH-like protein
MVEALDILSGVDGIGFMHFTEKDVVRHPLVQSIIRAYDDFERRSGRGARSERRAEPSAGAQGEVEPGSE